jgi:hypothetical protein
MSTDEPATIEDEKSTKMPPNVSLPLTFQNSFWTSDYRTGLNVLFGKLEQVCVTPIRLIQSSRRALGYR